MVRVILLPVLQLLLVRRQPVIQLLQRIILLGKQVNLQTMLLPQLIPRLGRQVIVQITPRLQLILRLGRHLMVQATQRQLLTRQLSIPVNQLVVQQQHQGLRQLVKVRLLRM